MFHSGDWQISYQPLAMHFPFPPVMFNQNAFSLRWGSFSEIAVLPFFILKNKCNKIWQEYKGKSGLSTERPQLIFFIIIISEKDVFLKWLQSNIYIFICVCSTSKIMDEDFFVILDLYFPRFHGCWEKCSPHLLFLYFYLELFIVFSSYYSLV